MAKVDITLVVCTCASTDPFSIYDYGEPVNGDSANITNICFHITATAGSAAGIALCLPISIVFIHMRALQPRYVSIASCKPRQRASQVYRPMALPTRRPRPKPSISTQLPIAVWALLREPAYLFSTYRRQWRFPLASLQPLPWPSTQE